MNKQGSTLIIALMLMLFMTTLGTLIFQTAQALQALSIERTLQRPPQILLESLLVYVCQTQGTVWLNECTRTAGVQPHASYTITVHGVPCTVQVGVEKGVVVVRATCPGSRGVIHKRVAQLGLDGEHMVIRAWQSF